MVSKEGLLEVREHSSGYFSPRTYFNVSSAGLTVAFAVNFETAGEKLTRKAAGDNYLAIPLGEDPLVAARALYRELKNRGAKVLNVAGNGIYTLIPKGWTQEGINAYLFTVIGKVQQHWPLEKIVSGGQTGADLAGVTVAYALGIRAVATLPKGFLQRGPDNKNVFQSEMAIRNQIDEGAARLGESLRECADDSPPRQRPSGA